MTTRAQKAAAELVELVIETVATDPEGFTPERFRAFCGEAMTECVRLRLVEIFGDCAAKAGEAEPIFTLRAQDKSAVAALGMWITFAEREGAAAQKLDGAREIQRQMVEWAAVNETKVAD